MSTYAYKNIECPCCKTKYKERLLMSHSRFGVDMELDTNDHNPAIYDRVLICPTCGYAGGYPFPELDEKVYSVVLQDEYKKLLHDEEYDPVSKKMMLAGHLAEVQEDYKQAGQHYLAAYWNLRERNAPQKINVCRKALENYNRYLAKKRDVNVVMVFIDLLRQIGDFDQASSVADNLESHLGDSPRMTAILTYEKKLIEVKDHRPHKLSEV